MIVAAEEDGESIEGEPTAAAEIGEVGEGVEVDGDVEEKVLILVDGNAYLPVPFKEPGVTVVVLLLVPFDFCKFPDDFFFNPPAGNGGNDFSLFTDDIPLVDESRGGAAGSKISFGVLGIGMLRVEETDEGVFPFPPVKWLLSSPPERR